MARRSARDRRRADLRLTEPPTSADAPGARPMYRPVRRSRDRRWLSSAGPSASPGRTQRRRRVRPVPAGGRRFIARLVARFVVRPVVRHDVALVRRLARHGVLLGRLAGGRRVRRTGRRLRRPIRRRACHRDVGPGPGELLGRARLRRRAELLRREGVVRPPELARGVGCGRRRHGGDRLLGCDPFGRWTGCGTRRSGRASGHHRREPGGQRDHEAEHEAGHEDQLRRTEGVEQREPHGVLARLGDERAIDDEAAHHRADAGARDDRGPGQRRTPARSRRRHALRRARGRPCRRRVTPISASCE